MKDIFTSSPLPNIGDHVSSYADNISKIFLLKKAILEGGCVHQLDRASLCISFDNLVKMAVAYGGELKLDHSTCSRSHHAVVVFDDGVMDINGHDNDLDTTLVTRNIELCNNIRVYLDSIPSAKSETGYVYSVMKTQGGLNLHRLGHAGVALERDNYVDDVLNGYDNVIENFNSLTPFGRVVILDGVPGSGKSFIVRGIINDTRSAMFVMIPPSMVSELDGPSLLPLLLENKEDDLRKGPIVLVLEDADHAIVPRMSDNMSYVSSLLNLGDGILGSIINIRIIATTNAKVTDIDSAILRPGRLLQRISVGSLDYDKANSIYQRLSKKDRLTPKRSNSIGFSSRETNEYTLAEVYQAAKEAS